MEKLKLSEFVGTKKTLGLCYFTGTTPNFFLKHWVLKEIKNNKELILRRDKDIYIYNSSEWVNKTETIQALDDIVNLYTESKLGFIKGKISRGLLLTHDLGDSHIPLLHFSDGSSFNITSLVKCCCAANKATNGNSVITKLPLYKTFFNEGMVCLYYGALCCGWMCDDLKDINNLTKNINTEEAVKFFEYHHDFNFIIKQVERGDFNYQEHKKTLLNSYSLANYIFKKVSVIKGKINKYPFIVGGGSSLFENIRNFASTLYNIPPDKWCPADLYMTLPGSNYDMNNSINQLFSNDINDLLNGKIIGYSLKEHRSNQGSFNSAPFIKKILNVNKYNQINHTPKQLLANIIQNIQQLGYIGNTEWKHNDMGFEFKSIGKLFEIYKNNHLLDQKCLKTCYGLYTLTNCLLGKGISNEQVFNPNEIIQQIYQSIFYGLSLSSASPPFTILIGSKDGDNCNVKTEIYGDMLPIPYGELGIKFNFYENDKYITTNQLNYRYQIGNVIYNNSVLLFNSYNNIVWRNNKGIVYES